MSEAAGEMLLTIFLKHHQSMNLGEINRKLEETGFWKKFPPEGTEVVSWYVMMGIGQVVTLCNGIEAAVVDFNPRHPLRPKVQCLRSADGERFEDPSLEEIDLAIYPEVYISAIDGQDVTAFQDLPAAQLAGV